MEVLRFLFDAEFERRGGMNLISNKYDFVFKVSKINYGEMWNRDTLAVGLISVQNICAF